MDDELRNGEDDLFFDDALGNDDDANTTSPSSPIDCTASTSTSTRTRGVTQLEKVRKSTDCTIRICPKTLKPIGEYSAKYCTWVGLEVKSRISILISDWHKVEKADKDRMWMAIKALSKTNSERAKMNNNPHHLGSRGKEFFLAPYAQGYHWSLLIIRPRHRLVYILDSKMSDGKKAETYLIKEMMEMAITKYNQCERSSHAVISIPVTWKLNMCNQQKEG